MKKCFTVLAIFLMVLSAPAAWCDTVPISDATRDCLDCHETIHPGIVEDWRKSRHAAITPKKAMKEKGLSLKVSSKEVPDEYLDVAVGCAECHTGRSKDHPDTFNHNEYDVHTVVSPQDCSTCHAQEVKQYSENIMSYAFTNLDSNLLYQDLQHSILGKPVMKDGELVLEQANVETREEACYYCHGTKIEVKGSETRDTDMGEMDFPVLSGWPNQGVGRINPDGSRGSCTACHTRHIFSMEMARKPYTCKECHVGPDVPAFKVYTSSKHGNIFSSLEKNWNFSNVPWTIGKDFQAPTCATCHISLVTSTDGEVVAERTHTMSDRLSWRIFGLIYAHPQPKDPDTTKIRNKSKLPLPTDLDGEFASDFLIDKDEMAKRTGTMQNICAACHSDSWVKGHWARYENTIKETNDKTLAATQIMQQIWNAGYAKGPSLGKSPFDEAVEKKWADIWLFYANTTRFASAMAGGGDYGVFADGRYQINQGIMDLKDWLDIRNSISERSEVPSSETKKKTSEEATEVKKHQ